MSNVTVRCFCKLTKVKSQNQTEPTFPSTSFQAEPINQNPIMALETYKNHVIDECKCRDESQLNDHFSKETNFRNNVCLVFVYIFYLTIDICTHHISCNATRFIVKWEIMTMWLTQYRDECIYKVIIISFVGITQFSNYLVMIMINS